MSGRTVFSALPASAVFTATSLLVCCVSDDGETSDVSEDDEDGDSADEDDLATSENDDASEGSSDAGASSAPSSAPSEEARLQRWQAGSVLAVFGGAVQVQGVLNSLDLGQVAVVDWHAPWAAACRNITSEIMFLAQKNPKVRRSRGSAAL